MNGDFNRNQRTFRKLVLSNSFLLEALVQLLVEKGILKRDEITELVERLEMKAAVGSRTTR